MVAIAAARQCEIIYCEAASQEAPVSAASGVAVWGTIAILAVSKQSDDLLVRRKHEVNH